MLSNAITQTNFLITKGHHILCLLLITISFQCTSTHKVTTSTEKPELKFLDQYVIPFGMQFDSTTVGGLSGIDYDESTDLYASICDDRSDINPARYYIYQIKLKGNKIDTVIFKEKHFLNNALQQLFPPFRENKKGSVDPEALRFLNEKNIIWSDEGLRQILPHDTVLVNPRIFLSERNGTYIDTFKIPGIFHITATESGPRNNGGFEGLSISPGKKFLWVSTEEPLLNDGPRAGLKDTSGVVRILKFDIKTRNAIAQYAYKIDPVAHPVFPPTAFRVNGISDILFLDSLHLLVVERSYSTGRLSCTIKVFIVNLQHAEDISHLSSLKNENYSTLPKKMLVNMDTLGIFIDNIEGVTYGPRLQNGNRSLIFIADNNFNRFEVSQLLLFEIMQKHQ